MTLRQILAVLWARKWIIVIVIVCALAAACGYLALRTMTYTSETKARLNTAVAGGATSDDVGGVAVNFGEQTITSPAVLDAAGKITGDSGADLVGNINASIVDDGHTTSVVVRASGPTPHSAQARAAAVMKAYTAEIDKDMAHVLVVLQQRQQAAISQAQTFQHQVAADPTNSIASTNLATALSRMSSISTEIDSINNAGPTAIVLSAAALGISTAPSVVVVVLLALVTGIIVGIGVALIRDQFDDRLRGEEDLKARTGVPMLAGIPWDRRVSKSKVPLPVAGNTRTDLGEGLRTLRSTLQVLLPAKSVIVITSVEPGDGKSFVGANLALAWARAGRQVILVGGDLRRPGMRRYYGNAAGGQGLAEILEAHDAGEPVNKRDVARRLHVAAHDGLRILPAGHEPDEPADLLAQPGTADVFSVLRELADVVIVDSPPAIGMADASLLAVHADGAIVIATERRTDRSRLTDAVSELTANGASVLGVVVNRSTRKLPRTYASYYGQGAARTASGTRSQGEATIVEPGESIISENEDSATGDAKAPEDDASVAHDNEGAARSA